MPNTKINGHGSQPLSPGAAEANEDYYKSSPEAMLRSALASIEKGDVLCSKLYIAMEVLNPNDLREVAYSAYRSGATTLEHIGLLEMHKSLILDERTG